MLRHLIKTESSDSPLVRHLLTSWCHFHLDPDTLEILWDFAELWTLAETSNNLSAHKCQELSAKVIFPQFKLRSGKYLNKQGHQFNKSKTRIRLKSLKSFRSGETREKKFYSRSIGTPCVFPIMPVIPVLLILHSFDQFCTKNGWSSNRNAEINKLKAKFDFCIADITMIWRTS